MKNFKTFFHKTLLETPRNTGEFESGYSDTAIAQTQYKDIFDNPDDYKLVFKLYETHPVYLYENVDGNDVSCYFVPKNDDFIYGYATYELRDDGGIEMWSVYNRPMYYGLAQSVYNNYIIPKYKYILSNSHHSLNGRGFWRKLVMSNAGKRHIDIWDIHDNVSIKDIKSLKDLDDFYGNFEKFEKYRIRISSEL